MTALLFRRRAGLEPSSRNALGTLLKSPKYELIPLKHALDQAAFLPAGSLVAVTASPAKGIEATIQLAAALADQRHVPVAHLSAREIRDAAHLAAVLHQMRDGGIRRAFVVGGDGDAVTAFRDGLALLRAVRDMDGSLEEVGIPCYPEGHPSIPDQALLEALSAKAPLADYMTTQLCFNPAAIASWLAARRSEGILLPASIGVPGPADLTKLMTIAARIGVADSRRFLAKNPRLVGRLILGAGGFAPDGLLEGLAPVLADPAAGIAGIHLYTFNQVEAAETWRRRYLAALVPPAA